MHLPYPHHLPRPQSGRSAQGQVVGYRFGRYVLTQKIAQGGMAEIFKAKYLGESGFSKEVVIKRLLPIWSDNLQFINMLIDEAKALVHLSHPNIVQVFELGRDGKVFYISMEFVEGIDLRRFFLKISQETIDLPPKFILFIVAEVLKALDYAHNKKDSSGQSLQIVHRDISPQNILLSYEGQVKVADFGIAKGSHRSIETTQAQVVKGKYAYMSPEQARGEKVDARTDLYAVGILLYELLEKKRLFDGVNDLATLEQVREARLPANALQKWPAPLRAIVFKALQKDPNYRYQTAGHFLTDLQHWIAKESCPADSLEFSDYLKESFSRDQMTEVSEIEINPETQEKRLESKSATWVFAGASLLILLLTVLSSSWGLKFGKTAKTAEAVTQKAESPSVPTPPLQGSITIDAKPKSVKGLLKFGGVEKPFETPFQMANLDVSEEKEGFVKIQSENGKEIQEKFILNLRHPDWVKTFYFEKEKPGILKVAARPWGQVTIPGVVSERETPVANLSLNAGEYRVRVYYPPADQWMEKQVQVASGSQIICQADFGNNPTLVCR